MEEEKLCVRCSPPQLKPIGDFHLCAASSDKHALWCKTCASAYKKSHKIANEVRVKHRIKQLRHNLKDEVIAGYGGKCKCCGETERKFLTLDHVYGREGMTRNQLRSGLHYREAKRLNYPAKYQVLCFNCNCAKGFYGVCPHQEAKLREINNVGRSEGSGDSTAFAYTTSNCGSGNEQPGTIAG